MRDKVALKEARFVTLNAHNLEPIVLSQPIPPTKRDRTLLYSLIMVVVMPQYLICFLFPLNEKPLTRKRYMTNISLLNLIIF